MCVIYEIRNGPCSPWSLCGSVVQHRSAESEFLKGIQIFFPVPRSRQDVKTSFSKMRFIFFRTEYWTIFRDFVSRPKQSPWWQYAIILSCLAIARHSCCLTEHHIGHNGSTSGCNALASLKHLGSKQNYFHLIKLQKVVAIDRSTDRPTGSSSPF